MSIYQFIPSKPSQNKFPTFVTWRDGFSENEIAEIISICEHNHELVDAVVGKNDVDSEVRRTKVAWIKNVENTSWIYDRIAYIARSLNSEFYNFDLYGFVEDFQYTFYSEEFKGHYDWHYDMSKFTDVQRKFSIVLQLSSPEEYEGGDLLIKSGNLDEIVLKEKGLIAAFPSYTLHSVTPVTKGERRTLVIWVAGPPFK